MCDGPRSKVQKIQKYGHRCKVFRANRARNFRVSRIKITVLASCFPSFQALFKPNQNAEPKSRCLRNPNPTPGQSPRGLAFPHTAQWASHKHARAAPPTPGGERRPTLPGTWTGSSAKAVEIFCISLCLSTPPHGTDGERICISRALLKPEVKSHRNVVHTSRSQRAFSPETPHQTTADETNRPTDILKP